jgi:hypothetical protein
MRAGRFASALRGRGRGLAWTSILRERWALHSAQKAYPRFVGGHLPQLDAGGGRRSVTEKAESGKHRYEPNSCERTQQEVPLCPGEPASGPAPSKSGVLGILFGANPRTAPGANGSDHPISPAPPCFTHPGRAAFPLTLVQWARSRISSQTASVLCGTTHEANCNGAKFAVSQICYRQYGMYGPPPCRKRKVKMDGLVCANVSGLFVSRGSGP